MKLRKSVKVSIIIVSVIVAVIALCVGFFFLMIEPSINILGAPNLDMANLTSYSRTVKIVDKYGNAIDEAAFYDNNKIYVRLSDLDDKTVNAFIAIEDKRFYEHNGVDYKRVVSAAFSNIKSRSFREGASTITQQLIKNTHLSNEKTIKRKINEMRLARALERVYSKERILESYFNILYFGSGIHGLGTASRVMFDKSASDLTVAEAAALASIINNPTKYSPYNNPENLSKRTKLVLRLMYEQKYITKQEFDEALNEPLTFNKYKQNQFVEGAIRDACRLKNCSEKQLFAGNFTLNTSYDGKITASARKAIRNMSYFDGIIRVLVLDNATGQIACDETNVGTYIDEQRSPASAIKPFISYAPALEKLGYNPMTQINDVKTNFGDYSPRNYKDVYRGWQSLEDCLIHSSNVAAVKLFLDVGAENSIRMAQNFGLRLDQADNTPAAALGGLTRGVTLSELANAYRTLANGGLYSDCGYIGGISDNGGYTQHIITNYNRVVSQDTAYIMTDMLTKCAQSGTAKKLNGIGNIAAKTGTNGDNNGNYDCYCLAYTVNHTVAVWFGAKDKPIDNSITGASCAKLIKTLFDDGAITGNEKFKMPDTVAYYEIDNKQLRESHEVYLADPLLPKRYRTRVLISKKHLPIRKNVDYIDFFDEYYWRDFLTGNN